LANFFFIKPANNKLFYQTLSAGLLSCHGGGYGSTIDIKRKGKIFLHLLAHKQ